MAPAAKGGRGSGPSPSRCCRPRPRHHPPRPGARSREPGAMESAPSPWSWSSWCWSSTWCCCRSSNRPCCFPSCSPHGVVVLPPADALTGRLGSRHPLPHPLADDAGQAGCTGSLLPPLPGERWRRRHGRARRAGGAAGDRRRDALEQPGDAHPCPTAATSESPSPGRPAASRAQSREAQDGRPPAGSGSDVIGKSEPRSASVPSRR